MGEFILVAGFFYLPTRFLYCVLLCAGIFKLVFAEFNKTRPDTWLDGKPQRSDKIWAIPWFLQLKLCLCPFLLMFW